MQGVPKHINTRFDLDIMLEHFPDEAKDYLRNQLDSREKWITQKKLYIAGETYTEMENDELVEKVYESDEPWEESETSRVVEIKNEEDVVVSKYGELFMEDSNWYLSSRLGMSYEEALSIINN